MQHYLDSYKQMVSLRGLTDHTLKSYATYIRAYLDYLENILGKQPEDVTWQELRDFVLFIQARRSLADRTVNTCISQLRFFTLYVLHKPWDPYQLPSRKFDSYLPFVPTKQETQVFISSIPDLKPKAMVSLIYSAGLRIGEVCHLKCSDIDRKSMCIHVARSKNRSDRYAILSPKALSLLEDCWRSCGRPGSYLFPQKSRLDKPIRPSYLSRHIHAHEVRLGWKHRLTCHSFRHAFGTHLYESGTDLLTIKALLGHKSLNSTTIYVQLANGGIGKAVSPFDTLEGF
ncbi:tyrosine-type recombinase/integrase [Anaerotalea alkaliphila]|uniref:Tyrosine-type recombinase/integrase n=1 Tax=Anaerotalea alkaliphila TaxID=2662126 RepID=A0A7X5HW25_9FIRM|nr:tyrosine-type recombinase/integrase [Anaerotalea alkaliphila]NDL67511.1 tyrosine-type recombinase/integrase [Anaerotalea alkaliphila]